jgi:hypothetical protein
MYVLIYLSDTDKEPIAVPDLTMEDIENRVAAMGLSPDDYCVVHGELIKDFDHDFHPWRS